MIEKSSALTNKRRRDFTDGRTLPCCSGKSTKSTYKSWNLSRERSAVKTSKRPITCGRQKHFWSHYIACQKGKCADVMRNMGPPPQWTADHADSHIFMFHMFEKPQLPVGPLGEQLRLERSVQLLDRYFGSRSGVHRRAEERGGGNKACWGTSTCSD